MNTNAAKQASRVRTHLRGRAGLAVAEAVADLGVHVVDDGERLGRVALEQLVVVDLPDSVEAAQVRAHPLRGRVCRERASRYKH